MKYLKFMALLLAITTVLAASGASAKVVTIVNLTIPRLSGTTTTNAHTKDNFGAQSATKTGCTDNLSGNEMAVQAQVFSTSYNRYGGWKSLPKGSNVTLTGSDNIFGAPGEFKLNLKATNSFVTTGNFNGSWNLN